MAVVKQSQCSVKCNLCEEDVKLNWKCIQCDFLICGKCKKIHMNVKSNEKHTIIDIKDICQFKDVHDVRSLDFKSIICEEHPDEACCLYCDSCDQTVCSVCVAKTHKFHNLLEIKEKYEVKTDTLNKEKMKVQSEKEYFSYEKEKLDSLKSDEKSKYNFARQEILTQELHMKEEVGKFAKNLLDELDKRWAKVESEFDIENRKKDQTMKNLDDRLNELDSIINNVKMSLKKKTKITEMQNTENEVILPSSSPVITPMPEFVPGSIHEDHFGILKDIEAFENESSQKIEVTVTKEFQTKLSRVSYLSSSHDDALWIGTKIPARVNKRSTLFSKRTITLQKVKPEESKLKSLCELDVQIIDIATTRSNSVILVTDDAKLKEIDQSDKLLDSKYNVESYMYKPTCIHFTKKNAVVIGGRCTTEDQAVVILLDMNGRLLAKYDKDEKAGPIFINPLRITSTGNGNIWVIDAEDDNSGSVVVLTHENGVHVYSGNLDMDTCEKQFNPQYITTTPLDNIIVTDTYNHMLHVLNKDIQLLAHYSTRDIGILYPTTVVFTSVDSIYIGSSYYQHNEKAKLYKVNFVEY